MVKVASIKNIIKDLKPRQQRDNLLKETDYYALSDVTMSNDMKTYRQQLRDITNGVNTEAKAKNKEFPTKPE